MPNIAINEPASFEYHAAQSVEEALDLAAKYEDDFAYLAGGCDILDMMKRQWDTPRHVIDIKRIEGLQGIGVENGVVNIGALTKLAAVQDADLDPSLMALKEAASRVESPQIRNMGTVGGNLLQDSRCPYCRGPFYCYRQGGIVCNAHHGINREHALFGGDRCYTVTPSDLAPAIVALAACRTCKAPEAFKRQIRKKVRIQTVNWANSGISPLFYAAFSVFRRNTAMRFKFHARHTRVHSPRTFFKPRSENWRNPSTDLMIPNTGSTVCLRTA